MSCNYKFRFNASIKNGQEKAQLLETYSFPRCDAEKKLAELRVQKKLHPGEVRLKELLEQALKNPRARKFSVTVKRKIS